MGHHHFHQLYLMGWICRSFKFIALLLQVRFAQRSVGKFGFGRNGYHIGLNSNGAIRCPPFG